MAEASNDPYSKDNVINKLRGMKLTYSQRKVYDNPVTLLAHFTEFEAYTSILESHYAMQRDDEHQKDTTIRQDEYQKKDAHNAVHKSRSDQITVAQADNNVEYRMRIIRGSLKELETETRSCRNHVNAMQSILKSFGDEAKSIR